MATLVPRSLFIQQLPSGKYVVGTHLRMAFNAARQVSTEPTDWQGVQALLEEWNRDREEFLLVHFDWNAATIDAQIAKGGKPKANPHGGLSLADLGL